MTQAGPFRHASHRASGGSRLKIAADHMHLPDNHTMFLTRTGAATGHGPTNRRITRHPDNWRMDVPIRIDSNMVRIKFHNPNT